MALSISKELLSAVLKTEIDNCEINRMWCIYNYVEDEENDKWGYSSINIYELACKVKEWAFRQGYYTSSGISFNINLWWANATPKIGGATRLETFEADNEPEAIFQAGEWVLKDIIGV